MSRTKWWICGSTAVVTFTLAGCASSHHSSSSTTTGSPASATTLPSSTVAPPIVTAPTTAAASTTTAPSGPQACATADLAASLSAPNGTAGTIYYYLQLRNTGPATCTLAGYPGVSLIDSAGQTVGASATRTTGTVALVTLAPGASAQAVLGITDATAYGPGCGLTSTVAARVYPPSQTAALDIAHADHACTNTGDQVVRIGPVTAA
jgi:hypothetical protein